MAEAPFHNLILAQDATPADVGTRLDRFVAQHSELSRARLQKLIRDGQCTLLRAGKSHVEADPSAKLLLGDHVQLALPPPVETRLSGQPIPLNILYEDDALLVLDKPAGLVVHPAPANPDNTLVNALLAHCGDSLSGIGGEKRPGIVHRLDKQTSGIMVVAKNDVAHAGLAAQFAAHGRDGRLTRHYQALLWGAPRPAIGKIDAPLGRAPNNRTKMAVSKNPKARQAITHYKVLASTENNQTSHVQCSLETGRTHQIRVHMAHLGHPLLGDKLYGTGMKSRTKHLSPPQVAALTALDRQALHATHLGFVHPISKQIMRFDTPLPTDMQNLATTLGFSDSTPQ